MEIEGWEFIVASDPDYDHLVLEMHKEGKFMLLMDREDGRNSICVAFPMKNGELGSRISLNEFIEKLREAADNLKR